MQYKLVVLDMDGTLLNDKHQVSAANKEAIQRLKKHGIHIVLASGRPYESIYPYVNELGTDLPIIAANGALIKSPLTSEVYYSAGLPIHLTKEIVEYGQENQYPVSLYLDGEVHTFHESMVKVHWELEKLNAKLIEKFEGKKDLYKIIYRNIPEKIEEAFLHLEKKYRNQLYITRSDDIYLDIMNINVSKGMALRQILETHHFSPDEVVVMGNSYNDTTMFEVAGLSIAMENSPAVVKEAADFVTKSNNEDGVAYALERYIY
ncbi:HAD family hydrolase [Mesobacillus campisalis]|uniref:HAD family hydrolase n=1 Tax=Mesobacillus campisalis TaxID=1408103 RepID=A0A0M2SXN5_9BACI|nr:Cof-type HAD-IIB family hydrolase [Mesobacillus campisalis]KKK38933.1 HAD family hydrolase [Mesobacillus campisalis]